MYHSNRHVEIHIPPLRDNPTCREGLGYKSLRSNYPTLVVTILSNVVSVTGSHLQATKEFLNEHFVNSRVVTLISGISHSDCTY